MNERRRIQRETDDEILAHLDHRINDLVARGMSRRQAEEEAIRRFGPLDTSRSELFAAARHRDRVLTMYDRLDALRHDVAYAIRQLRRAPGLAATVVVTFALGVGANATMFGLLDRLLLRPPAYISMPEQLVRVQSHVRYSSRTEYTNAGFSYPAYAAIRDRATAFSSVAMYTSPNPVSYGLGASAHAVKYMLISGNYFATLGVRVPLGRPILPADDELPNGSQVVVISDGLWQREFGGNPQVIGQTINLAGRQYTIVGVAPRDFLGIGTRPVDVWLPVAGAEGLRFAGPKWATDRTSSWMTVTARLRTGQTSVSSGQQVAAVLRAFNEADKGKRDTITFAIAQASILANKQPKLSADSKVAVLLGAVSVLVLLIACANVANLLLARALQRKREIAVRVALGISRARLARQLIAEGLLLAALGGAGALVAVRLGGAFMYKVLLTESAPPTSFIDARIVAFTLVAVVGVGLATSLIPAIQASRPNLSRDLKEGTRGAGIAHSKTRVALLLIQAALSVVLLAGTGAFITSLRRVYSVNLGMDVDHVLIGRIDLRSVGMDSAQSRAYFNDVVAAAGRLPGAEGATVAEAAPFTDWSIGKGVKIPGRDSVPHFERGPYHYGVDERYFQATGTRILRGRGVERSDLSPGSEPVVVINEDGARTLWPNEDALGKCLSIDKKDAPCARIVGIARDTHAQAVVETGTLLQIYSPLGRAGNVETRALALLVRTSGDPANVVEPLRRLMQTVHAGLPFAQVMPMSHSLDQELRPWRLGATLFGVFGAIALVLSALGLYSVVAYSVAQRTHEMGVRVALGAQVRDILRLVLTQGLGIAALGVAIGTGLTVLGAGAVKSLLYETSARDPLVLGMVATVLLAVAAVASLIPALRATRADPLSALRAE